MLQGEHKDGSVIEHLEELRWALIRSLLSVAVLFPVAFYFSDRITAVLVEKMCPVGFKLRYFSPVEPFLVQLKMAAFIAIFIAAPYILRQAWGFIAPGLYGPEKRFAGFLLLLSCILFAGGAAFALVAILPVIMTFSTGFQTAYLEAAIGFEQFISLAGMLALAFGAMFQCPAIVFVLVKTGLVTVERIIVLRPVIIVVILVISAILTPPDVFS
ncbi:MAG: twin-arginine translocase subunit TatC, partial [Candidatus Riflebacteria bacterium]|nr:twin-arginine translocase subunit TatC [Candidatus Riflebacteria bacterium]